jgi:dTDP-4-dehydrorhamnose reductase
MKVLVVGARGRLGAAIAREFASHADVVALGRSDLDITDDGAVRSRVEAEAPDAIVNCAAFNAVDAAEDDPVGALEVNAYGVRALALAARSIDAALVHYGSDFVFDGRTDRPYVETDTPNPQSAYAVSKLLGEWFAADAARFYVLRVASLFGHVAFGSPGSADKIIDGIEAGAEVPVFTDRTISPTYVVDAAATTRALLERDAPSGVYHCVNSGRCSWLEFAEEAARALGRAARLKAITLETVAMRASRPRYAALSNATLVSLGFGLPPWENALRRSLLARARA